MFKLLFKSACTVILLGIAAGLGGCAVDVQDEIQMGRDTHEKFEKEFGGRLPDESIQRYTNSVGMDMARYAGRPELPWQFHVLNSDQINAFAVPGGYIYLTQGLLFRLRNEAQLAGVLGHECGHIAHRDSVQQIQRTQAAQVGAVVIGAAAGGEAGNIAQIVESLALMSFSRDQEKQADLAGLSYMSRGGYNPQAMVQLMEILQQSSKGGTPPQFFSTHPSPSNRLQYLQENISAEYNDAAQMGRYDADRFRRAVLDQQRGRLGKIDLAHPNAWCMTCWSRAQSAAAP